jgi:hypothetical protein
VRYEDDAERAVRSALELVDAVDHQGMVTGDMVNTAARLQSSAESGSVLVGEATVRAASGAIAFERAGELALKGKEEPVRAQRAAPAVRRRRRRVDPRRRRTQSGNRSGHPGLDWRAPWSERCSSTLGPRCPELLIDRRCRPRPPAHWPPRRSVHRRVKRGQSGSPVS